MNIFYIIKKLFSKTNRRCTDCKKYFKVEDLKIITYHEGHRLRGGKENLNGGLHTLILCKSCYENYSITTEATSLSYRIKDHDRK